MMMEEEFPGGCIARIAQMHFVKDSRDDIQPQANYLQCTCYSTLYCIYIRNVWQFIQIAEKQKCTVILKQFLQS